MAGFQVTPRFRFSLVNGCVVILAAILFTVSAQIVPASSRNPSQSRKLTLRDAVRTALTRNYRVAKARQEVRKKEHKRVEAFSDFFPSIEVQYTATADRYESIDNVDYFGYFHDSRWLERIGVVRDIIPEKPYRIDPYKTFVLTATLTQPLFSGGKLINKYKDAKLGLDSSRIQLELDKQDLILEVYRAYYQMVRAQKVLETTIKSIAALQETLKQSEAFFRAGIVLEVDVLSSKGQLAKARISKRSSEKAIEKHRATLNFLLRYPQNTTTRVVLDTSFSPSTYKIPEIYTIAARNRLEITKSNISVEQALAMVKVAQARLMPTVDVKLEGTRTNDDWNAFDGEAYNDWTIEGVLTWTFDMFGRREKVKRKQVGYAQRFIESQLVVQEIMEEVQKAFIDMKRAEGNISDYKIAVDAYVKNYQKNIALYKEQLATYREVLDAEQEAASAGADYYRSLLDYKIYKAVLERKMGVLR
jgi:outer membrane protein